MTFKGFRALAAVSGSIAMSKARQELTPQRTVHQVNKDIRVLKEKHNDPIDEFRAQ